jgi:hypothetical protein
VTRLQNAKKKQMTNPEMMSLVKQLITKTDELERKYDQICKDEDILYDCLKDRISQLQMIDEKNYTYDNLKIFCSRKINNLLLDFFLRERFLETARNYIDEEKISVFIYITIELS